MADFIKAREKLLNMLKSEIHGPEPIGEIFDTSSDINLSSKDEKVAEIVKKLKENSKDKNLDNSKLISIAINQVISMPYISRNDHQEIMTMQSPREKYGAGILFPIETHADIEDDVSIPSFTQVNEEKSDEYSSDFEKSNKNKNEDKVSRIKGEDSEIEIELPGSNLNFQNSLAVSFNCKLNSNHRIVIENLDNPPGVYSKKKIFCDGEEVKNKTWWVRKEIKFKVFTY